MVRVLFLFALLLPGVNQAQNWQQTGYVYIKRPPIYRMPGLLSASATYAPGIALNRTQTNYYLNGFAEYHISSVASVKSDSYWFLNSPDVNGSEMKMLRSHFGMYYHFQQLIQNNSDLKVGFLPGVLLSKGITEEENWSVSPSLQIALQYDFYFWKYFHFFSQVSYVHSNLRSAPTGLKEQDELLFSVGLGFQLPTKGWRNSKPTRE